MTEFIRTPDKNFGNLADFKFAPHYHNWQDMRMHIVDEGPRGGPVMFTWYAYLELPNIETLSIL